MAGGVVTQSRWRQFWERGGAWKAVLAAVVYFALYEGGSLLFAPLLPAGATADDAVFVVVAYALPVLLGGLILVAFALSVGWLGELFGPQPIRGRGWMWIAVVVVLLFNLLRFATIDYGSVGFDFVAAWLLAGLLVGFAEEVLTRGFVVNLMRKAGHGEVAVALVSAAVFAGLHSGNLLSGQSLFATALQLVYTFAFGICMYLALRVTGNLIWPILLHASTDSSVFLQSMHPAEGPLAAIAGLGNIAVIAVGLVLVFFIRGRVSDQASVTGVSVSTGQRP